eukprot:TRINITY_DN4020_c0_g1_i1.p1 TRINITY_DN4020_c0_g1~~TRINITY_DN4020_c0_g1_i1.p1  ORF type:complete len:175 (-),score=36.34 TRINITY_DN4020_c0_g1_i1:161-685(-)
MRRIGCVGEVGITKEEDYSNWGIQIKVKFRDANPLAILDAHVQSGGERSVATMLYLISMQDLTECPFRLVDEINQGMDPRNERMIFQEVVKASCRPGLPQYFLITPKLLSELTYTKDVTILCVINAPWLSPQWNPMASSLAVIEGGRGAVASQSQQSQSQQGRGYEEEDDEESD